MGTPKASERLSNAAQRLVELDRTVTVESMQAALEAMEAVPLPGDPEARRSERASIAHLWLRLLAQLDASLDPNFDPEDRPVRGGVSAVIGDRELTPGADSALIDDPKVRAAYERNLRESRQKAESYNRQVRLRYLEPRIETGAFRALRQLYRDSTEDRAELDQVLSGESLTPERRARLERWLGAR